VAYLAELPQDFRDDEMNADESLTRGRIRHALLPLLEREYNPQVRAALERLGQQACDVQETIEVLASRVVEQACEQRDATSCRLNCDVLADAPRHLLRECLALVWKQMDWPRQRMGFAEWERLAALVCADGAATLPGHIEARRRGRLLVLQRAANRE
jgi:tRNA(Ile)-lysidine synthase